jgi:hypothetical protein
MNLELVFKQTFASDVYRLLETQVDRMTQRHSSERAPLLEVQCYENFGAEYWDHNWRLYDGWLYKVEVRIFLERYEELGIDYVNDLYPNPGSIPIEISPLGGEQERTTVRVLIDWHPSEDIREIRPYFVNLVEPWERAWGGVMLSLVRQAPVLAFYNRCEPVWDPNKEDWHFWFGYYEAVGGTDQAITLGYMAKRLGKSLSKVEKRRSRWKEQWQKELRML